MHLYVKCQTDPLCLFITIFHFLGVGEQELTACAFCLSSMDIRTNVNRSIFVGYLCVRERN